MPRITGFILLDSVGEHTLAIRARSPVEGLPGLLGESFGRIGALLAQRGILPSGMPYVAYYNQDLQDLDLEIGFPVAGPHPGEGGIQEGALPGGLKVLCLFLGPYQEIGSVYGEMAAWIAARGLVPAGTAYESYYNSPEEVPPDQLLTAVLMPVTKP